VEKFTGGCTFMASAEARIAAPRDWVLANPWFWMAIGLLATGIAGIWARALGDSLCAIRFFLIGVGLPAAGAALTIRLNSRQAAFLETMAPRARGLALTLLLLILGVTALTLTVLLVSRVFGIGAIPWKPGSLVIVWILVAPVSAYAARLCWQKTDPKAKMSAAEEGSAMLVLGALAFFFASWGLYLGPDRAEEWDTIRLLLSVMAFVSLAAAPLLVVPQDVRRTVISLVILLHFGGICTAVLASPPIPWLISQLWTRIYRPYLEFMYLNNAYHFYSPEPGPASYLWFRLQFLDEQQQIHGQWCKIPEFDDKGRPAYPVALTYQRVLALTENTNQSGPTPSIFEMSLDDKRQLRMDYADYYKRRVMHTPDYKQIAGANEPDFKLRIPFHPYVALPQQYFVPSSNVKQLLESYSRHVARVVEPEDKGWTLRSIKVYRVVHIIPPEGPYLFGMVAPNDPEFYRPYFVGEYDPDGNQVNFDERGRPTIKRDPFLYWLLPIVRDYRDAYNLVIRDYARLHAGDSNWIYHPHSKEWAKE
jgi:hypothetical protein